MVPAHIGEPRNRPRARLLARVESWLVVGGRIYRHNEVRHFTLSCDTHGIIWHGRGDMAALLSRAGKDLTVTVLLDALQQTKDFELSMAKKFGTSVSICWRSKWGSFQLFSSYKTSCRRHHRRRLEFRSRSVPLLSHTWGYMYSTKTSEYIRLLSEALAYLPMSQSDR